VVCSASEGFGGLQLSFDCFLLIIIQASLGVYQALFQFKLFASRSPLLRSRPARPWVGVERCALLVVECCLFVLALGGWGVVIALVAMSEWWISRPRR
jgi:hypothetical protein